MQTVANHVWAYDFVFDTCANGQQLKCQTVVDEWTREALPIDIGKSIRSGRVIEVLARLVSTYGAPKYLRSDNGPEFVASAVLKWVMQAGIETVHITRQAMAKRYRREFQRQVQRGVLESRMVQKSGRSNGRNRGLATALQCCAPSFELGLLDA